MKRFLPLASAALLSLAATSAFAKDVDRLPQPSADVYALAPQATLAASPALASGSAGMALLPAPLADPGAAGPLRAAPGLKVASIGAVLSPVAAGTAGPNRPEAGSDAFSDRLPSTPVALAALFLIICILIGRRNRTEQI